jgi:DNA-binding MarR family transcriptional regulator
VADIARSTGYSRPAVQRRADALVAEGAARYCADESDRRRQRLELTGAGAAVLGQMEAHFDVWAARLTAELPGTDLAALTQALEHIRVVVLADAGNFTRKGQ